MATCIEYHEQRTSECDEWEDQGYNSCSTWNPLVAWLCIVWAWVTHLVCVGWTWITTLVCILWDTAVTLLDGLIVTLEGIGLGWLLNLLAAIIELIFLIPVLGPIIQWIWNVVLTAAFALLNILDTLAYIVGIRPQKKLRVCTVIFQDTGGNPVAVTDDIVNILNTAIDIYFSEMNVVIIRSAPFQYSTGFLSPSAADASWITTQQVGDDQLTGCCNECMAGEELWVKGSARKLEYMWGCFWGNWRRLLGWGSPVVIFVLRNMESETVTLSDGSIVTAQDIGCGLGPLTDFVTIAASANNPLNPLQSNPDTLAHELGHLCNLWHLKGRDDTVYLMFSNDDGLLDGNDRLLVATDDRLLDWQCVLVRMSRHVSYF